MTGQKEEKKEKDKGEKEEKRKFLHTDLQAHRLIKGTRGPCEPKKQLGGCTSLAEKINQIVFYQRSK